MSDRQSDSNKEAKDQPTQVVNNDTVIGLQTAKAPLPVSLPPEQMGFPTCEVQFHGCPTNYLTNLGLTGQEPKELKAAFRDTPPLKMPKALA